ncbi:predicted protein, partial [Arabidopsis lyrata subsp. lyrata]
MSSDNVNEGTKFAFDLNLEPVDETLDINVDHVDEENRDALNPVDEENHNSMNHVDEENHDSLNPIDEEIRDSPNDSYTPGDLDSCSICRGTLVNECIGSAYNAKGFMECPNCRNIEPGEWQFADGTHFNADNMIANDDEQEEDNDPGCFSQLIVKSEVCPFGCLGQRYPFLLGRSGISMVNAPMALSYASSSTTQLNPSNVWESTQPFLSLRHHCMVEHELYRMIYGDRNEMGEVSGNHGGSRRNRNNGDGGSGNFGGNGNGN